MSGKSSRVSLSSMRHDPLLLCRRHIARRYLKPNELPFTLTSFPRLGVPGVFTEPHYDPANAVSSHSLFLPEEITNPHARFPSVILLGWAFLKSHS